MAFHLGASSETSKSFQTETPLRVAGSQTVWICLKNGAPRSSLPHLTRMSGSTESASTLLSRIGLEFQARYRLGFNHAVARPQEASTFSFPLARLTTCLQFAECKKSEWEQSCQKQSKRRGFRDAGALERSGCHRRGAA